MPKLTRNQGSPTITRLMDVLGEAKLLVLCQRWGGVCVWVPKKLPPGHVLVEVLGLKAAHALSQEAGGNMVLVPKATHHLRTVRDQRIKARHAQGDSISEIALTEGLHIRQVMRVLHDETTSVQRSLFS